MHARVFSLVLFFLSFGLFSFASPLETTQLEARDNEKRAVVVANVVADLLANVNVLIANVLLDAQINVFLNVLGLIVVNINVLIAPLIINLKLLLSLHLTIIANIFINILGIVIIL